jgi:hypothetical protein
MIMAFIGFSSCCRSLSRGRHLGGRKFIDTSGISESDALARHLGALDAGADPQLVAGWMAEAQARRAVPAAGGRE